MEILFLLVAYLLGSIPFGLLLVRAAGLGDVRNIGSGNIGATNVMRTGKKWLGIATLLLDAGKGFLAIWLTLETLRNAHVFPTLFFSITLLSVVLGHVFPVWLKFKGGKGVATAFGAIFAFYWPLGLGACIVWLLTLALSRIVSVASIASMWSLALLAVAFSVINHNPIPFDIVITFVLLALLITWTHRANIARLRAGTEPKIRKKKS
ncbi:MAG: glycerol-3-phosphate 1-O-acyltransferase PlsY [Alphaproteobacteria bacterium]